jgi:alanyl-tRNA synthetase
MEQKFKSGLADNSDIVVAYHTVAHLLLSATKKVLMGEGESIHQAGQNITADRLRYDMTFSRKIDGFELAKIEEQVNWWISKNLKITFIDLPKEFALQIGAEALFKQKYDETVRVYFIYDPEVLSVELLESELDSLRKYFDRSGNIPAQLLENSKIGSMRSIVSKEFCAGPHVGATQEIGKFGSPKIVKEESSGSGVRRIKVQFE